MFVVAGCDGPIVLDAIEEPFDAIAEFVGTRAEGWRVQPMIKWADIGISASVRDLGPQMLRDTLGQ